MDISHLHHDLLSYEDYYNATHTHLSLNKDAPVPRGVEWTGSIVGRSILGGLHHQYGRMLLTIGTAPMGALSGSNPRAKALPGNIYSCLRPR